MTDLYKILGVPKTATIKTIRAAYRKKAKKAHPDTGGDVETFAALKRAHDILTDDTRRTKYDATGDTSEKQPDNSMAQVIGILASSLDQVLAQINQRNGNPTEYELVKDMKILLGNELDKIQRQCKELEKVRAKTEKLLGQFGVKDGENYLEGIIIGKLSALDTNIRIGREHEEPVQKALDILKGSTFRSDSQPKEQGYGYGQSSYRLADLMNMAMY